MVQTAAARSKRMGVVVLKGRANASAARREVVELFFDRLRVLLKDRRMSQADLARDLGVGEATVSEWFTRGRVPQGDVMLRLPHVLQVSGHWLLTGDGARELAFQGDEDPYLRGVRDAVGRMGRSLDEIARGYNVDPGQRGAGPSGAASADDIPPLEEK